MLFDVCIAISCFLFSIKTIRLKTYAILLNTMIMSMETKKPISLIKLILFCPKFYVLIENIELDSYLLMRKKCKILTSNTSRILIQHLVFFLRFFNGQV